MIPSSPSCLVNVRPDATPGSSIARAPLPKVVGQPDRTPSEPTPKGNPQSTILKKGRQP